MRAGQGEDRPPLPPGAGRNDLYRLDYSPMMIRIGGIEDPILGAPVFHLMQDAPAGPSNWRLVVVEASPS
jgi:hypothetical protein